MFRPKLNANYRGRDRLKVVSRTAKIKKELRGLQKQVSRGSWAKHNLKHITEGDMIGVLKDLLEGRGYNRLTLEKEF